MDIIATRYINTKRDQIELIAEHGDAYLCWITTNGQWGHAEGLSMFIERTELGKLLDW